MAARTDEDGGLVIEANFAGRVILDFEAMRAASEDLFGQVGEQGICTLVLSFQKVGYLSSEALGLLLTLDKQLRQRGSRLVLCHLDSSIYEIFELTNLDQWFTIRREDSDTGQESATSPQSHECGDEEPVILPFPSTEPE